MTAQVKRLPHPLAPDDHALWVKYDRIANRLHDLSQELGTISWAAAGLRETISDGDHLAGIEKMSARIQNELEAISDEIRL